MGQLDLERNSAISKHKAVLGTKEEGLISCFKKVETSVTLNSNCKYPETYKNTLDIPDM